MNKYKSLAAISLALLFLGACSSSNGGGIFGSPSSSNPSSYDIRGTVDSVDTGSRSVYLTNVSGLSSMLSGAGGNNARVYYDDRTAVEYQGRSYRPEDLERGDQISVRVDESNNRLLADSMTVTYNAGGTGTTSSNPYPSYPSSTANSSVRGTVRSVDTSRRTIEVDRGYGSTVMVEYDTSTPVYWSNQTYHVADLERGDEIDVRVNDYSGRLVAQDITVTRNVSGNTSGSSTSSQVSTLRGTVRYIDTSRNTIELGSTSWVSGFSGGSGAGTIVVQFDSSTNVDVQGRLYPVANLDVGDVVDVQVTSLGGSTYRASRIFLVRDVNQR
jgi:hypothetical protein